MCNTTPKACMCWSSLSNSPPCTVKHAVWQVLNQFLCCIYFGGGFKHFPPTSLLREQTTWQQTNGELERATFGIIGLETDQRKLVVSFPHLSPLHSSDIWTPFSTCGSERSHSTGGGRRARTLTRCHCETGGRWGSEPFPPVTLEGSLRPGCCPARHRHVEKGFHLPVVLSSDSLPSFSSLSKVLLEDEMLEAEQLSLSFTSSFCLSFSLSEALSSGSSSSAGSSWLSAPWWAEVMSRLASSAPCPASASSSGSWSLSLTVEDKSRDYINNRFLWGAGVTQELGSIPLGKV